MAASEQKSESFLSALVPEGDVWTSSELIDKFIDRGLSRDAARQALRRACANKNIWRSERLLLARDERLFALRSTVGTSAFYKAAARKLRSFNRHGMARCLDAISERHLLHKVDLMRLLAVSESGTGQGAKRRRIYDRELAAMEEIGFTVIHRRTPLESVADASIVINSREEADQLASIAATSLRKEAILSRILGEWLRRQNLCSWNLLELPDPETPYSIFNGQVFSSYGFSYLSPVVRWRKGKAKPTACPVLIDVYYDVCSAANLDSFLQRIDRSCRRGRSFLPCLGVIAAKDFTTEAWTAARRSGLMTINLRQLFGDEALEAMVLVEELLRDFTGFSGAPSPEDRFEDFATLLGDLKTNPVVVTLRSIGFEAIGGLTLRSLGYENVDLGRIVPWMDTVRDVDVYGFAGEELRILECKAYHKNKSLLPEDVTKFFTQTVPALKKWLTGHGTRQFKKCRAEIWTTGPLGTKARDELFGLRRPANDEWKLVPEKELDSLLPDSIKRRASELLSAIAMESSDENQPEARV